MLDCAYILRNSSSSISFPFPHFVYSSMGEFKNESFRIKLFEVIIEKSSESLTFGYLHGYIIMNMFLLLKVKFKRGKMHIYS